MLPGVVGDQACERHAASPGGIDEVRTRATRLVAATFDVCLPALVESADDSGPAGVADLISDGVEQEVAHMTYVRSTTLNGRYR